MSKEVDTQTNSSIDSQPRMLLPAVLPTPNTAARISELAARSSFAALQAVTVGEALEPTEGEAALDRLQPMLNAIPEQDVLPRVNTSVRGAAITGLGALQRILSIRPDALTTAPNHNLIYLDSFEDVLLALLHTDTAVQMSIEDKKALAAKAEPLFAKRDQYVGLAQGLARFDQMDARQLEAIGKEPGYKALGRDVSILVAAFRQNWSKVGKGMPFTLQDLAQLDRDATALNVAIGEKEQNPDAPREVTLSRRRVFTLFRLAVADIRRLAIYLYGEDAVDDIIPSFSNFTKGKGGTKGEEESTEPAEAGATPATPGTNPATPGTTPAAPGAAAANAARPSGFVVNNPDNLPITPPFIDEDDAKKESA